MPTFQTLPRHAALRDALRAHTRQQHERLHEHSCFLALFDQSLGIEEYRHLIQRLYGFYQPLDRAIGHAMPRDLARSTGYTYVSRARLLAQDMRDLGSDAEAVKASPRCHGVAGIVSPARLGGVVYVIEGATLGGSRIDRATCRLLARDDPAGRRFWSWCRAEAGHRWPMTNRYLEVLQADGADIEELKRGALDTFRLLADWLAPLDRARPPVERRLT